MWKALEAHAEPNAKGLWQRSIGSARTPNYLDSLIIEVLVIVVVLSSDSELGMSGLRHIEIEMQRPLWQMVTQHLRNFRGVVR